MENAGWFDLNPATMHDAAAPSSVYADLVKLAGGPEGFRNWPQSDWHPGKRSRHCD